MRDDSFCLIGLNAEWRYNSGDSWEQFENARRLSSMVCPENVTYGQTAWVPDNVGEKRGLFYPIDYVVNALQLPCNSIKST